MYHIDISPEAAQDISDHYLYIKDRSAENAKNWYFDIMHKIQSLKEHPARCPIAYESRFHCYEIRNLIVGNFRVLYRINQKTVQILHVKRCSQDRVPLY